jgi:hypothetical protein
MNGRTGFPAAEDQEPRIESQSSFTLIAAVALKTAFDQQRTDFFFEELEVVGTGGVHQADDSARQRDDECTAAPLDCR